MHACKVFASPSLEKEMTEERKKGEKENTIRSCSLLPPTDLATETGLDGRDGPTGSARVAGHEV
jgi:hypothetical protein